MLIASSTRNVGKLLFGRRFRTHGGQYRRVRYLDLHGVETGVRVILEAGFQIKNVLETRAHFFVDAGFQHSCNLETSVNEILHSSFQKVIKSGTGVCMTNRRQFLFCTKVGKRRRHEKMTPVYILRYIWKQAST